MDELLLSWRGIRRPIERNQKSLNCGQDSLLNVQKLDVKQNLIST